MRTPLSFVTTCTVLMATLFIVAWSEPLLTQTPIRMDSHHSFSELLEKATDFDLVDGTFIKIGDRYHHWVDASKYSPEERVVMLVWHGSGIIDNGGFEYLFAGSFDGDPSYKLTAEAHKSAGLPRSYQAFLDAFSIFPDGKVPEDEDERHRLYMTASEARREALSQEVWKDGWDKLREKKLADFIRQHSQYFSRLDTK